MNPELLKILWNSLNVPNFYFFILDKELKVKLCNDLLLKTLNFNLVGEIIGKNWLDFLDIKDKENLRKIYTNILNGDIENTDYLTTIKSNNLTLVNLHISRALNGSVNIVNFGQKYFCEDNNVIRGIWKNIIKEDQLMIKTQLHEIHSRQIDEYNLSSSYA